MADDDTAAPVLQRRKFYSGVDITDNLRESQESKAKPDVAYRSCRVMCRVFVVSGWLFLLEAAAFVVLAALATQIANANDKVTTLTTTVTAALIFGVAGFGQFASAELLGGVVAYLLKHDCRPAD